MSLGLIVGVLLIAVVAYVTWSNRQSSFSKTHLGKSTDFAAHQKEIEDQPEEDQPS